jgi:hypothetical protein
LAAVEGECSEEFPGRGVDDADVEAGDEHGDGGSGAGSADADVVEAVVVARCDLAGGVGAVVADSRLKTVAGSADRQRPQREVRRQTGWPRRV